MLIAQATSACIRLLAHADGATLPIQAVATDLQMKPIRGKVEGKHTGKTFCCDHWQDRPAAQCLSAVEVLTSL